MQHSRQPSRPPLRRPSKKPTPQPPVSPEDKFQQLKEKWREAGLPDKPKRPLFSPLLQRYAAHSLRKVIWKGGRAHLEQPGFHPDYPGESALQESHIAAFQHFEQKLAQPPYRGLSGRLRMLGLHGHGPEMLLSMGQTDLTGSNIRKVKLFTESFRTSVPGATGAYAFSAYAHGNPRPMKPWEKKYFGPDKPFLNSPYGTGKYCPLLSSWPNASLLPPWRERVREMLKPTADATLLYLGCEDGFLFQDLRQGFGGALGMEYIQNAWLQLSGKGPGWRIHLLRSQVTGTTLSRHWSPPPSGLERVFIYGAHWSQSEGAAKAIAARMPSRMVQWLWDWNELAQVWKKWARSGYMLAKALPVDYLPDTQRVGLLTLWIPSKLGQGAEAEGG